MKTIVLFGGTFDPVHNGHVAMLHGAVEELAAEAIVLPAGNPWQRGRLPIATAADRVAMLRLAFGDAATLDERELKRQGPTYTIDTLIELRNELGAGVNLMWLIGADAFSRLDTWHRWRELFDYAEFAVVRRESEAAPAPGRYRLLAARPPGVSSTLIRTRLAAGESIRDLAPGPVCDYIDRNKLYRS